MRFHLRGTLLVVLVAWLTAGHVLAANSVGQPGSAGLDDGSFFLTARF